MFNGKKVYITGITGFKGSWLALMCKELGAEVSGFGLTQENKNHIFYKAKINEITDVDIVDIRYLLNVKQSEKILDADFVFHLAAQPLVSEGYKNPLLTFRTNTMGTCELFELLRSSKKKQSIVNVTTDKVYKPNSSKYFNEEDELRGNDPYSLSKSMADMIASCYIEHLLPESVIVSNVRAGNVIGGGDYAKNRIMTDLVNSIYQNEVLEIRNPNSIRPYQYVLDCLYAYILIADKQYKDKKFASNYNVGPDKGLLTRTIDLVNAACNIKNLKCNFQGTSIGKENSCLMLDNSKIKEKLGWKAEVIDVEELMKKTLAWYDSEDKEKYSKQEVINFLKRKEIK